MLGKTGAGATDVGGLTGWVLDVVEAMGAVGLGLLTILETLFPPLPSEIFLPAGGYVASQGGMSLIWAWTAATAGSLIAAWVLFVLGDRLGKERMRAWLTKLPLMHDEDLDPAEEWFERHGTGSVFFGRLVPGVRSLVSIPAGSSSMGVARFSVFTTLGSGVWNALLIGAGWYLGRQWRTVEAWSTWLDVALAGALVVAVGVYVWKRRDRIG